ncbi:hypothetical protein, partial [Wolbachia endosymbiont of Drosophila melanogaster]|uniref:hypothetical protein n=2 Tax=Wolbachia pipientis wMel TaxID=163164 RepID=UPI001CA3A752
TSLLTIAFQNNLMHHSFCKKHSTLSLHFFWIRSYVYIPIMNAIFGKISYNAQKQKNKNLIFSAK